MKGIIFYRRHSKQVVKNPPLLVVRRDLGSGGVSMEQCEDWYIPCFFLFVVD
jgi:hypothetical protein